MSTRPTPSVTQGQGVARIFKHSVKNIGIKNATDTVSGTKNQSKKESVSLSSHNDNDPSRTCHFSGGRGRRTGINHGDAKKGDVPRDIQEKVVEKVKDKVLKVTRKKKLIKEKCCFESQPSKPLCNEAVIDHFTEDWNEETISEDIFKTSVPQKRRLQSTPKKQSKNKNSTVNLEEKSDVQIKGESAECCKDLTHHTEQLTLNKQSPVDEQKCLGEQLATIHLNKENVYELTGTLALNVTCGTATEAVISGCEITIDKGMEDNKNNNDQHITNIGDRSSHGGYKDTRMIIAVDKGKDCVETFQSADLITTLCSTGEYLPPMPELNESIKEEALITKEETTNSNGNSNCLNGNNFKDDGFNAFKDIVEPFKDDNSNWRCHDRSDKPNRRNLPFHNDDIPPRFQKAAYRHHESYYREPPLQSHRSDSRPWKKTLTFTRSSGSFVNRTKHPRPGYRPMQTNFLLEHNNNENNWGEPQRDEHSYQTKDHMKHEQLWTEHEAVDHTMDNMKVENGLIDTWASPCSEDWTSELCSTLEINEKVYGKQNTSEFVGKTTSPIRADVLSSEFIEAVEKKCDLDNEWVTNVVHTEEQYIPPPPLADSSGSLNEFDIENVNEIVDTGEVNEELLIMCPSEVPYLPPAPPSNEPGLNVSDTCGNCVEAGNEIVNVKNDCDIISETNVALPNKITENESYGIELEIGCFDKARRDVNFGYFGSGTSDADISELPSDEVVEIISTCGDDMINQNRMLEESAIAPSQEGYGDEQLTDVTAAGMCTPQQPSDYRQWDRTENYWYGEGEDYRDWWNSQYGAAYSHWYYNIYLQSCTDVTQGEVGVEGHPHIAIPPECDVNETLTIGLNARKRTKGQIKMESLVETLHSDLVTARTTDWVNSHVVEDNVSLDNVPTVNIMTERLTDQTGRPVLGDNQKHLKCVKDGVRSDLNGNVTENADTLDHMDRQDDNIRNETNDASCSCYGRDVKFITWRVCQCRAPIVQAVNPVRERNADLGYCSYESNLDLEDSAFIRQGAQSSELAAHSPNTLCKPTSITPDWKALDPGSPYLYEQFYSRYPPQHQHVYMLHSSLRDSSNSVQHQTESEQGNTQGSIDHKHGTDVNGNRVPPSQGTHGELRSLIDNINPESRTESEGQGHMSGFEYAKNPKSKPPHVNDKEQLPSPLKQSGTHLTQVETNLSSAEKTNSQFGKSFSIISNAISAIKQYTDNLHTDNGSDSKENVLPNEGNESLEKDGKVRKLSVSQAESQGCCDNSFSKEFDEPFSKPRIEPFAMIRRREKQNWESSSGPISESSDDICKDSVLSQSPDIRIKKDPDSQPHYGATDSQTMHPAYFWPHGNIKPKDVPPTVSRYSPSYRGGGVRSPASSVLPARYRLPRFYNDSHGNSTSNHSGQSQSKPFDAPMPGFMYRPQFGGPMLPCSPKLPYRNTTEPSVPATVTVDKTDCTTPSKYSGSATKHKAITPIQRRLSQLVDYGNTDDSSSEADIEPFDVDSLSTNPRSVKEDPDGQAYIHQGRASKKLKQDTTSDDDSTSTPPSFPKHDQAVKKPVTFMKRPQRKLSHKTLKSLPSDDFPKASVVKSGTTPRKSSQPQTIAEMISMARREESNEQKNLNSMTDHHMSRFDGGVRPPLPPLPPFPQSQFWSMYLPKYNSALTGKQESTAPKTEVKSSPGLPVTPEWNRPSQRRSWGGAACAIPSPSDTESETVPRNDWKTTFKRFHNFGVKYIDTHCHLDFLFKREGFRGNLKDYMEKSPETFPETFEGCVAVFCNPMTFTPNGGLWMEVAKEDNVWIAMGCHPKMATDFSEAADAGLQKCLTHSKCVALGEIGLDYSGKFQQFEEIQKRVFRRQLTIALEMKKPLVIHCRDAEDDCLDILKEMVPRDYKIHCHCFTGYFYNAKLWMDAFPNLFIGVTPLVTFRTATPSHDLARNIPLNRLLLETDAPYFIPRQIPKDEILFSNPGLAITVAKEIAQYQELPVAAVLRHCRLNTKFMYGI